MNSLKAASATEGSEAALVSPRHTGWKRRASIRRMLELVSIMMGPKNTGEEWPGVCHLFSELLPFLQNSGWGQELKAGML